MIKSRHLLLYLIVITLSSCTCNQTAKHQTTKYHSTYVNANQDQQLDNDIWAIHQDQDDNYWFGSNEHGVYVYDGTNVNQYTEEDGLVDNSIRGFQEDQDGNLYIETPDGISRYDGSTFETLRVNAVMANEWRLEPDDLWFNCNSNTLNRYDGEYLYDLALPEVNLDSIFETEVVGLGFKDMNHSPYAVYGIDKDQDGNLWIGTITAGAYRYDGHSFLHVGEKELTTLPDGRVPGVRSMLQDKDGYVWLSNFVSKYQVTSQDSIQAYQKLDGIANLSDYFPERLPYYNSGLVDRDGNLWMTTYTGGVWMYDGAQLANYKVESKTNEALLLTIYEDNNGVIWVGSRNTGVFRFDGERFEHFVI